MLMHHNSEMLHIISHLGRWARNVLFIVILASSVVANSQVVNLVANLHPAAARRGDRENLAQAPVHAERDQEAAEVVDVVDIGSSLWHGLADGTGETDNVDQNTRNVGGISAPMDTEGVEVRSLLATIVEFLELEIPLSHEVVVGYHDSSDGAEEHTVGGKIGGKLVAVLEQLPRADGETNNCTDVSSTADIDPSRKQSRHVSTSRDGVGGDVGTKLRKGEGHGNDKDSETLGGATVVDELVKQVKGIPDRLAVHDGRCR